jgi:hypothetical protein
LIFQARWRGNSARREIPLEVVQRLAEVRHEAEEARKNSTEEHKLANRWTEVFYSNYLKKKICPVFFDKHWNLFHIKRENKLWNRRKICSLLMVVLDYFWCYFCNSCNTQFSEAISKPVNFTKNGIISPDFFKLAIRPTFWLTLTWPIILLSFSFCK